MQNNSNDKFNTEKKQGAAEMGKTVFPGKLHKIGLNSQSLKSEIFRAAPWTARDARDWGWKTVNLQLLVSPGSSSLLLNS